MKAKLCEICKGLGSFGAQAKRCTECNGKGYIKVFVKEDANSDKDKEQNSDNGG